MHTRALFDCYGRDQCIKFWDKLKNNLDPSGNENARGRVFSFSWQMDIFVNFVQLGIFVWTCVRAYFLTWGESTQHMLQRKAFCIVRSTPPAVINNSMDDSRKNCPLREGGGRVSGGIRRFSLLYVGFCFYFSWDAMFLPCFISCPRSASWWILWILNSF